MEGAELFFYQHQSLSRVLAAKTKHWSPEEASCLVNARTQRCELGDAPRLHRYWSLTVLNRRVSSVRDVSLDGCG
ncbi:hypothetical protein OAE63_00370, partial [bacterium]|nr:hypothetical protein [bacterium]